MDIDQESRRNELALTMAKFFGRQNGLAARAISTISGRQVSARTIQAWLIDPSKRSSRNCPVWALEALKRFLDDPSRVATLQKSVEMQQSQPRNMNIELKDRLIVELAENSIEADESRMRRWETVDLNELPKRLAELEKKIEDWSGTALERIFALQQAVKQANDFHELKKLLLDDLENLAERRFWVDKTKKDIQLNADEFSNLEGTMP